MNSGMLNEAVNAALSEIGKIGNVRERLTTLANQWNDATRRIATWRRWLRGKQASATRAGMDNERCWNYAPGRYATCWPGGMRRMMGDDRAGEAVWELWGLAVFWNCVWRRGGSWAVSAACSDNGGGCGQGWVGRRQRKPV